MRGHFSKIHTGFVVELWPTICKDGRGNRDVRCSKSRGRAIIGSIIPGNDSPAEGNWSLVIPPGLLLRAGNNYEFAVNRGDSHSMWFERDQPVEPFSLSLFSLPPLFLSLSPPPSLHSRPRMRRQTQRPSPSLSIDNLYTFFLRGETPMPKTGKKPLFLRVRPVWLC